MKFFRSPGSSKKKSRKEQAKQGEDGENKRRRNFGFLKSSNRRMSTTSLKKTREHAKQLAMVYSDPADTPTSVYAGQKLLDFDVEQNQADSTFDPFNTKDPTASTQGSSEAGSFGSSFVDSDFFASQVSADSTHKKTQKKLDQFVEKHSPFNQEFGGGSLQDTRRNSSAKEERSVISMPNISSNAASQSASRSVGAAARRRMRSQMNSSISSVASEASSFASSPSQSPGDGRMAAYLEKGRHSAIKSGGSFMSNASSANSTANSQQSSMNLFDTDGEGGFTFDAFGLDQNEVERDVNQAMQELRGQGVSGFSDFFRADDESEFANENWDSPEGSRHSSPTPLEEEHDGFRVARQTQNPSPGSSSVPEISSAASRRLARSQSKGSTTPSRWQTPPSKPKQPKIFNDAGDSWKESPWKEDPWGSDPEDGNSDFQSQAGRKSHQQKAQYGDEHDMMQEEFAEEFAEDFVRRVSPRHEQTGTHVPSQAYGQRKSDFGAHGQSKPETDYGSKSSKFSSFRSRYESSRESAKSSNQKHPGQQPMDYGPTKSPSSPRYRASFSSVQKQDEQPQNDYGPPKSPIVASYRSPRSPYLPQSDYGPVKSPGSGRRGDGPVDLDELYDEENGVEVTLNSYAETKAKASEQNKGTDLLEEKKDDAPSSDVPKAGNLKAKWRKWESQSKTRPAGGEKKTSVSESKDQRTQFSSLREKLKSPNGREGGRAKSEVGTGTMSPYAAKAFDRIRRDSPSRDTPQQSESLSDAGSPPSFPSVTLRKTPSFKRYAESGAESDGYKSPQSTNERPTSYRMQKRPSELSEDRLASPAQEQPVERKLTYRERRELELNRAQEERAKLELNREKKQPPKKDVAALIRKRIAANKEKSASSPKVTDTEEPGSQIRDRLKNVDWDNVGQKVASSPVRTDMDEPLPPQASSRFQARLSTSTSPRDAFKKEINVDEAADNVVSPKHTKALLNNLLGSRSPPTPANEDSKKDAKAALNNLLGSRLPPTPANEDSKKDAKAALNNLLGSRLPPSAAKEDSKKDAKAALNNLLGSRLPPAPAKKDSKNDAKAKLGNFLGARQNPMASIPVPSKPAESAMAPAPSATSNLPALKDDPNYERYFRMLKVGMPMEVVKHAMEKDGKDPSVMDGDHNKPVMVGVPLKEDPKYQKYFKMLKIGMPMVQVKHALARDGLMPEVMDQDHNLPAMSSEMKAKKEPKEKATHRRARLHWKTLQKVGRNSLWSKIEADTELNRIDIDEDEFNELFKADLTPSIVGSPSLTDEKKGAAVRVIDAKRANNGGIILAHVKMSHDEMADAVDRIDGEVLSAQQIENIIEYLPTKDERAQLEKYMLDGGKDAAEKFDGLCECEKFMVSMMTVKHAKRKIQALLFKLQFLSCMRSIAEDASLVERACDELSKSSRLRQILGIVLQFGNRLNTAGSKTKRKAGAFTLDSLLKLHQAKAFDKKTTFLHYVILIVQRNNEVLLNFADELPSVLKADKVFWDQVLSDLEKVENELENVRRIALHEARLKKVQYVQRQESNDDDDNDSIGEIEMTLEEEVEALRASPTGLFTLNAIKQVSALRDKVEVTRAKFTKVLVYFGEEEKNMQPHELFSIFVKFCRNFNKAKEQVLAKQKKRLREERKKNRNQTPNGKPPSGPEKSNKSSLASSSGHHRHQMLA